ncbi:MAG: two-component regulator propeller domain-containing protein [Verrucomicrobiae bacterium]|nr:two-component regulator propeller domain-containing protein [Verrucomicrobiae bacterium]
MFIPLLCRILLLAGLWFCSALPAFAAGTNEEWWARPWQTEEGLPDNSVNGLAQTEDGYLWIGTPSGLARFDGLRFDNLSLTNVITMPNRGIITMLRGRHDTLWLAMDRGGLVRLSGKTSRSFVQELPALIPNGLAEGADGTLLLAYRGGVVYRVKDDTVSLVTTNPGFPAGTDICAVTADDHGHLWWAKDGAVGIFTNGVFHVVKEFNPPTPMRLSAAQGGGVWVCCGFHLFKCDEHGGCLDSGQFYPDNSGSGASVMIEDRDGDVWIGTPYNGLYRHSQSGFQPVETSHGGILSLIEDREGNIWAGTSGGGLNRIRERAITLEGAQSGLPFTSIESVCEAVDGTVWAVTQNGVLVRKSGDRWDSIRTNSDWPGDATCVTADARDRIWVGTRLHGLHCWQDGKFVTWGDEGVLRGQTLHTLLAGKSGDLWVGQESPNAILRVRDGRVTSFPIPPAVRIIRAMVEDAGGNIWVGTSKGTLLRITGDQIIDATPRPPEDLASIRCLYTTPDGALWIGYAGWGVGRLKDGHYTEVNTDQGLFDAYVSHIVADGQGWLWFGANRGLFKVRVADFDDFAAGKISRVRSIHYGRGEGLPSLQGTFGDSPDVLRSRDGRLWIPMQTALAVVDPQKIYENTGPPTTLLTRVLLDDRVIAQYFGVLPPTPGIVEIPAVLSGPATLHLPAQHLSVRFELTAFDFRAPENVQFRHRLLGMENNWVENNWVEESKSIRSATHQTLNSGEYQFEAVACNGDGDWSQNVTSITLAVAKSFWETWWFRSLVVLAFTGCIVAVVRYVSFRRLHNRLRVLEQQAALQRERARIAKDIHDDLGANLTQIAFMGELANQDRDEPNLVGERIRKISATARQAVKSLDEIVWAVNPRNDTLSHLLDYAGQFAVDYLRLIGIRCRLDFPETIPARELSTDLRHNLFLVVKESLHNIFKHANATEVHLRVVVDETALVIYIEDNGCGFTQAPDDALSDGLRNMAHRMADIGGEFKVESQSGQGTKIILRLPWPAPQ